MPNEKSIEIPAINIKTIELRLNGTEPLITHAWSDRAKKAMLDKQMKKATQGKVAKSPEQDYAESLYWLDKTGHACATGKDPSKHKGKFGFPTVAFKSAAVRAGTDCDMKMTDLRRAFFVKNRYTIIKGTPRMREDMVKLNGQTADIRYRAEFANWSTVLTIQYNANRITDEQIVNLFNTAGFGVGVGEWRPEKNGSNGTFTVA